MGASIPTGAEVRHVRRVTVDAHDLLLLHLGSILRAMTLDGAAAWTRTELGVSRVVGEERGILVVVSRRCVLIALDVATGQTLWEFTTPESRDLTGEGSVRLVDSTGGLILLIAPNYSTVLTCVDLSDPTAIALRWEHDFGSSIDAGFGPVLVVEDLLGLGRPQLVISSRIGDRYEDDESDLSTERIVLGRNDGHLYQAVLDLDDGAVLDEVAYRPDPGPYPCARPYGLLEAVPGSALVLVSCQVEEYVSITAAPRLSRRWGWFVERDWPVDEQELRPQSTSVADVIGDGRPRLVVGHWDGSTWTTLVIDVIGEDSTGETIRVPGAYFWGCADLDGSGVPSLILSRESTRAPAERGDLEIVDARTGDVRARRHAVHLVTSTDDELPPHRTFHADRRGASVVGGSVVVVDPDGRTVLWNVDGARELWPTPIIRVDDRGGRVVITDATGAVAALDDSLAVEAVVHAEGRTPGVLLWGAESGAPNAVVTTAVGMIEGWIWTSASPRIDWSAPGRRASLHRDAAGTAWVVIAGPAKQGWLVTAFQSTPSGLVERWDRTLPHPVDQVLAFGDELRVFVGQRVGPHTTCAVLLDEFGDARWEDPHRSAWASDPLAFERDGRALVAYDDHGVLIIRDAHSGELLSEDNWTAAYTTPVDLHDALLRADGSHGLELVEAGGSVSWRANYDVFALHPGSSCILASDERRFVAAPRRDGFLDIIDLATGAVESSIRVGPQAERRPAVGLGDVVVVGLLSGMLVAYDTTGAVRWQHDVGCAVETLIAARIGGVLHLGVGTADGQVRIAELTEIRG